MSTSCGERYKKCVFVCMSLHAYLTLHQYHVESVLREGIAAVLVVHGPDVAGDGGGDTGITVTIPAEGKQRALVVQQSG